MTNSILSLKDLKEDENNIVSIINELKQITFRKSESDFSAIFQGDQITQNLSSHKSNLDYFEEWLRNLNHVMTETRVLIDKLGILFKNTNEEIPSGKKVIELIRQIKKNFMWLKITGKKKYDSLCMLEKNIEISVENYFEFSDIELPPLYKFEDYCGETILNTKELDALSNGRHIENSGPIVIGQFIHNWHVKDHEIFLRVYKKFKDKNKRLEGLMQLLPHVPKEKILSHHNKYSSYCESAEKAKSKIKEWKSKTQPCVNVVKEDNIENHKAENPHRNVFLSHRRRQVIKKQVELWKNKENTLKKEKESNTVKVEPCKKKSYSYTAEERADIKKKLDVYRSKKSIVLKENKNFNDNAKFTIKKSLHELREKDKAFILQRKSKINKIYEKRNSQIRLQSKKNVMDNKHNPDNHRKLTTSVKYHMHSEKSPTILPVSVDLIPKLKIPQWKCSGT